MVNRRKFLKSVSALGGSLLAWRAGLRPTQAALQQFTIPPTVQHITETSATLYFRLSEITLNGTVQILQAGQVVQEIPFSAAESLRQLIVVENLQPATIYQYQVLVDGIEPPFMDELEPWNGLQFRTQPFEFPLRIAAIGDTGFGDRITPELVAGMMSHEPDLLFHLGDVVYHMNEYNNDHFVNWQKKYFNPFKPLLQKMPHYPTFGNHDLDAPTILDNWASYFWIFPPFNEDNHEGARWWYGFDVNGIQFLSLNSQLFYSYASLRQTQEDWLAAKLARTDVKYTVIFCHIPPFTSSAPHQWDGVYVAQQWSPQFEAAQIPLVLNGHAHVYERCKQNGVNYVTAGGGSNVIYGEGERLPQTVLMWNLASYPIIDLYEDRIHLTTYNLLGEVLDELDIPIPPSS